MHVFAPIHPSQEAQGHPFGPQHFGRVSQGLGTKDTISNVAREPLRTHTGGMQPTGKRTVQVNVKMTGEDFTLLQKAAHAYWPDAVLSNSGVLLGLAKMAARDILKRGRPKRSVRE